MEYRLLGPLRVASDGHEVLVPRPKDRAVLAFLLLHAAEVVSFDRLLDELWGERPPPTAKNSLQNSVSRLRKLLGANVLRTTPPGYTLDVPADDIDAKRFERLVSQSPTQAAPERAATLARALALWRGPALAEFQFEPFALAEASRLEELRLVAEEELIDAELELGRHGELVSRIEDLLTRNPLRERLRRQLMVALYRSGRQAEALEAYQHARATLLEELGIEPSPALRELERAILRQDGSLVAPQSSSGRAARPADVRERLTTIAVLFVDLLTPEESVADHAGAVTARAYHELRAAAEYHGGRVDRLAGDELVAVFGVPERHEDSALRAVRAAVQIEHAVRALPGIEVRAAVATGEVLAPGPAAHQPVAGAPVTLSRRIAERSAVGEIVADAATAELVRQTAVLEPVAPLAVRGRAAALPAFVVRGVREPRRDDVPQRTPLVGRVDELRAMRAAFEQAASEARTKVLALVGEAGLGKTRLATELAESLSGAAEIAIGRCALYGEGRTWLPLRELVEDSGRGFAVLERFDAPAAAAIRGLLKGDTVPIADAFWAARRFIESLARERPALVVLDDVHWAAPTFLDFVERLAAAPARAPVLVLCLARPELVEGLPGLPSLLLRPLHAREATQLVDVAGEDAARAVRARVLELMDGNPLFAELLLTYAREHGDDALASVPPTIEALLASRFDRLDPEARATLQRAAVAGREFRQAAVLQMSPRLEVPAAGRHLGDLAAAGIVHRVRPRAASPDGFRFHHALARDVAYASIPRAERADLHERFAEWLAAGGDAEDELLGFHLEQAHAYRRELTPNDPHAAGLALAAGNHLRAAGFRAHKRGDSPAAATLLARAASLLPARDCSADDLLCELAIAEWSAQDARRAAATLERAVDMAHTQRDVRAELRARIELANLRFFTGPDATGDELLGLAQQATAVFDQYDDARSLGRTLLHVGFLHGGVRRQNEEWREAAERALKQYRRTEWSAASCIGDLAAALVSGPVPARAARARCHELLAESKDDRLARAHVLVGLGALDAMLRRFAAARSKLADARAIYEESGFTLAVVTRVDRNLGRAELLARRPGEAARVLLSCCETFERTGDRGSLATTAAELAEACFRMRQHDEAARWAAVSEDAATSEDIGAQNRWRSVKAKLLADSGSSEAKDLAQQAVALTERTDATNERADALLSLAWVYRATGDVVGAAAAAEQALQLYEEKENEAATAQARSFLRSIALPPRV